MLNNLANDYYIPIHEAAALLDCTPRHIQGRISQGWFRYLKGKHGSRLVPKFVYMPDVQEVKKNGYVRDYTHYASVPEAAQITKIAKSTIYKKLKHTGCIRWCAGMELRVHLQDAAQEARNIFSKNNRIAPK